MALLHLSWLKGATAVAVAASVMLGGCADSMPSLPKISELNPFKEVTPPLPGKRIAVLPTQDKVVGELSDASAPIALPAPRLNDNWAQPGGEPNNVPGHLALSGGLQQSWSASAGKGTTKVGRVSASPIVYDGRIFTLDSEGTVTAFQAAGGSQLWRVSLQPEGAATNLSFSSLTSNILNVGADDGGGYGGGLAADAGHLYAASGYGSVVALDPATGNRIWMKDLDIPIRASPTVTMDHIFVLTVEGKLYCLSAADGTELWVVRGLPQQASLGLNASPAVEGDVVVVPYSTGDLVALRIADGTGLWSENLSRTRTTSQLASMSDAARPAVDNGTVFAVGHGGRMIATATKTGERLWSINVPGTQQPYVVGESVFVVDTSGQLMALSRRDGKILWSSKLPGSSTWSGPVLANNALWLASKDGQLVGVDAATGRVTGQSDIGEPVYVSPIVAGGKMYVLTDSAKLIAYN
jgi:outer membrane protein assembly factor BamB